MLKKILMFLITVGLSFLLCESCLCSEKVTVVLDPGHGGSNSGANYDGVNEKVLTLKLAKQVKEMLSKYDDIEVFLTREGDNSLSLAERAAIGKKYNADILISLHFNASENKNLYGSEVWVSGDGKYYAMGMDIGAYFLKNFKKMGLLDRGVKTRMSDNGEVNDYYGIIRESVFEGLTGIIVEHCYLDFEKSFMSEDKITEFAKTDADAIAEYFKLGTDAAGVPELITDIPDKFIGDDLTPPDKVELKVYKDGQNYILSSYAEDINTPIIYFDYSTDGGKSWSDLKAWTGEKGNCFEYAIPEKNISDGIILRAYNNYDLFTESNKVTFSEIINYSEKDKENFDEYEMEKNGGAPKNIMDIFSETVECIKSVSKKADAQNLSLKENDEKTVENLSKSETKNEPYKNGLYTAAACAAACAALLAVFLIVYLKRNSHKSKRKKNSGR